MVYRIAQLPMTSNEAEDYLYLCNTHNAGNIVFLTTLCLHINCKAHAACDLNFIVKGQRLLKVTGSHVHCKSGNISETVLDRCW